MSFDWVIAYVLLFGWIGALLAAVRNSKPLEELGRDVSVEIPMRVSAEGLSRVLKMKAQRKLKQVLKQNPEYAQLLSEYPGAFVSVIKN